MHELRSVRVFAEESLARRMKAELYSSARLRVGGVKPFVSMQEEQKGIAFF
jgi:hypothetical protein